MASSARSRSTTALAASSTTAHWPSHPIADLFPRMSPEERAELKRDMLERAEQGVDPLEHSILLYDGQIVDGRHRGEIWKELAEEDACNGFFKRNLPPTELLTDKHGTLGAWMRAKSANMIHRHIPADQKAAIVLKAMEMFPEIKAAFDQIKEENAKRKKKGKPLGAGDQRGNTAEAIGNVAGVGATTVKTVASVQKADPAKFEELVQGKTTAKKALKDIKKGKKAKPESIPKPDAKDPEAEDAVGEGESNTNDRLSCPECGSQEFDQERTMLYEERCIVEFAPNGEIEEEIIESSDCCGEDSSEPYQCKKCGWELVDDDGEPLTSADEIVAQFQQAAKPRHASSYVHETFQEWLDTEDETVGVDDKEVGLDWMVEKLTGCTDILPDGYCSNLDLPQGSTYGKAVAHLVKRGGK